MIELVKENPCTECGIKELYENCEDKCVQYRKWYQYQQGRADVIDELRPFIHKNYKGQKFIFVCAEDFKNLDLWKQLKEQKE